MKLEYPCRRAPAETIKELKHILAPVDFSESSKLAIQYAVSQARQVDGDITLLTVIPDDHTSFEYGEAQAVASLESKKAALRRDLINLAEEKLDGVRHQIAIKVGRPFEEIVHAANELDTDLIVIATQGFSGSTRVDLGSTAERVIRYATCPVLVVRCQN